MIPTHALPVALRFHHLCATVKEHLQHCQASQRANPLSYPAKFSPVALPSLVTLSSRW